MSEEPFISSHGPEFYEALGRAIRAIRAEQGVERRELAERSGVSYPYLSEIENGKKRPSSRALVALAEALRMPPSELLQRAEELTPKVPRTRQADRLAAGPAFAEPLPAPSAPAQTQPTGRWFESREPAEPMVARMESASPESTRQSALSELFAVAATLSVDDLRRLLDLARRLREQ